MPDTNNTTTQNDAEGVSSSALLALSFQSLIADKQMLIATANRDLAQYGEWQRTHAEEFTQIDCEMDRLMRMMQHGITEEEIGVSRMAHEEAAISAIHG